MTTFFHHFVLRPLPPHQLAIVALILTLGTTVHCLAYTALLGARESVSVAALWALLNILPWFACFELAKRLKNLAAIATVILITLFGVAALNSMMMPSDLSAMDAWLFQITRRVPGAILVAVLLLLRGGIKALTPQKETAGRLIAGRLTDALPLLPNQIEWIAAAGNYVEMHGAALHGKDHVVLHRASLSATEAALEHHGFVRIHRSVLVSREKIAEISGNVVTLKSGRHFRVGNRYRDRLAVLTR